MQRCLLPVLPPIATGARTSLIGGSAPTAGIAACRWQTKKPRTMPGPKSSGEKSISNSQSRRHPSYKAPPSSQMGKAAWKRNPTSSYRTCIARGSNGAHHEHGQRRWVRAAGGVRDSAAGKLYKFHAPILSAPTMMLRWTLVPQQAQTVGDGRNVHPRSVPP